MKGLYVASKTKHAPMWRRFRAAGCPIISTWIDEADVGQTADFSDLWERCIRESSTCSALVAFREQDDVFKGAWVEIGAALSHGIPVFAVGLTDFTISRFQNIRHFDRIGEAMRVAEERVR